MSQSKAADNTTGLEIAIIGMACRFPGANSIEEFWHNLAEGVESITYFTPEELIAAGESPENVGHSNYVPVGRIIDDEDQFDAALFGFSPGEAELIDPQQRMLLECAYEALERAGYDTERYPGLVGVFAGIKLTAYLWNIYSNPQILRSVGEFSIQIANDKDYAATRLSYKLNLGGPSVTVQSACSTALVAIHLACQALLSGECEMALAGGVAVRTQQRIGYHYREGEILSPDGRCRAFDAGARGTIFGNGLGMVVLKRLEDALADGDHISAVIKGSAINNDSALKMGYTTPGADGQERVVRAALDAAEVTADSISYVEAHGTGTPVGDPVEITALTRAFRASTDRRGYCALGSVKTNIGHLSSAAGVAGVIKTALALEHGQIPPSLLFERPNPEIDFEASPFFVNTELRAWERNGGPRRAGVSAFGIGGTNAHAILEEPPPTSPSGPSRPWKLLLLSAKSEAVLDRTTANLAEYLRQSPALDLADAAFTLQIGRRELDRRRMVVARDLVDAVAALSEKTPGRVIDGAPRGEQPPVVFMFSGQGSQHVGMFADLYEREEVFRREVDRCAELLVPHLGLDLRTVLYPEEGASEEAQQRLERTELTQPALFVVEYALAQQWMAWGVRPAAMIGHSIGEYVAACLAGVFSLADGLALVAARGRLMQALPSGSMLAVPLPEEEILPLLGQQLSLAALNAPSRAVVAGPSEAVSALAGQLKERRVVTRPLHTSHAFHSQMMEPVLAPFLETVSRVELRPPQIPFLSNVTGSWATAAEVCDPAYWAKHLRGTVRFADGVAELLREPERVLIEVGPGQALTTLARQQAGKESAQVILASARQPNKDEDDQQQLLSALGRAWLAGVAIDWRGFYDGEERRRVILPTYPFDRHRFFIEVSNDSLSSTLGARSSSRLADLGDWFHLPMWKPSVAPLPALASQEEARRWLVFAAEDGGAEVGLGQALAAQLRDSGVAVAVVTAGQAFAARGDGRYEIEPARAEDYDALLAALTESGGLPDRIIHCWALESCIDAGSAADELSPETLTRAQERSFYSVFRLARALGRCRDVAPIELAVVSSGIHRVTGGEKLRPAQALALGPCKVMPQEYPFLSCRSLDLEILPTATLARQQLLTQVIAELDTTVRDQVIAYRGGRRFVQGFTPIHLDRTDEANLPLRSAGVYLITGGLGGIGLEIAEDLARTVNARLVLLGRRALPPREEWATRLAGGGDPDDAKIRKVQALEELGGEVLVLSADVGDREQLAAAVETARQRFGALHGVIHAAGVAGGGMIQTRREEDVAAVLWPKLQGTCALAAVTAGDPLDFFVLCSSTIALLGNFGQVDYCAGNCFLDAFAGYHAAVSGVRTLSINWGAWSEVGMAVETARPASARESQAASGGTQGSGAPVPAQPIHPLLDTLETATEARRVYTTRFQIDRHWMLAEHRVAQRSALPGTSYLEMLRAAWEHTTGLPLAELRQVYFLTPLMVAEGESREVRTTLERIADGYTFRVQSRGSEHDPWQDHALGEVGEVTASPATYDLAALRASCDVEKRVIDEEMLGDPEGFVYWGPRWQCLDRVLVGRDEALSRLSLPQAFHADLAAMRLHPALLDVATAVLSSLAEGSYLPLSYRRLRLFEELPGNFYGYIRHRPDNRADSGEGRETLTADLVLLGEDGRTLVEIEGFTMKRVGEAAGRLRTPIAASSSASPLPSPALPSAASSANKSPGVFAQGGMRSSEGVEAFRRALSRWPDSHVAISPRDLLVLLEQAAAARAKSAVGEIEGLASRRAAHPRPDLATQLVAPRNEVEATLARIWQEVLGLAEVGVHDNFYELGGDSVLGIQILSRARDAGIELTSDQLFQHQTLAELAVVIGGSSVREPAGEGASAAAVSPEEHREPFGLSGLSSEERELLTTNLDLVDAYPLSPLQQGLLVEAVDRPGSGLYCEQVSFFLDQDIDPVVMQRAWQLAVERHPILRTSFLWEERDQPLQAVHAHAEIPISWHDWRQLAAEERHERLNQLAREERDKGFDVGRAPLLRIDMVRLDDSTYRMLISYSHLLLDGWSAGLLANEVAQLYASLVRGQAPQLAPCRPYRDYIAWLIRQERNAADFWRGYLSGFSAANHLGVVKPAAGVVDGHSFAEHEVTLPAEVSAALNSFVRQNRLTLNHATQGVWALVLAHLSGDDDVVFGMDFSGRPGELAGVDSMVGLFVNMLPVRLRMRRDVQVLSWLKEIQERQLELNAYQYSLLSEVQSVSEVPTGLSLFETIYNYASYPSAMIGSEGKSVGFRYDSRPQFPLHLTVVPDDPLILRLLYDGSRVEMAAVERILTALEWLLTALVSASQSTLGELRDGLRDAERRRRLGAGEQAAESAREKLHQRARRRGVQIGAGE